LLPEAREIAEYFDTEVVLTTVRFATEDMGQTGNINFTYARFYERRNQITVVTVFFDIASMTFEAVEFERGHSSRASAILDPFDMMYVEMPFDKLFGEVEYIISEIFADINYSITVELSRNRICVFGRGIPRVCR